MLWIWIAFATCAATETIAWMHICLCGTCGSTLLVQKLTMQICAIVSVGFLSVTKTVINCYCITHTRGEAWHGTALRTGGSSNTRKWMGSFRVEATSGWYRDRESAQASSCDWRTMSDAMRRDARAHMPCVTIGYDVHIINQLRVHWNGNDMPHGARSVARIIVISDIMQTYQLPL